MAATDLGGGERVLLEARACGMPAEAIELAPDNLRLSEFLACPVFDTAYYASQFAFAIRRAIQQHPEVEAVQAAGADGVDARSDASDGPPVQPFRISV
jgi:hypothetical protein